MADTIAVAEVVKEGEKFFVKTEINVDVKIAEQDAIIAFLQEQIARAEATKAELQGKK